MNHRHRLKMSGMSVGEFEESVDVCDNSPSDSFTHVQFLFRAYLMPITYLFGILANAINVIVFSQKPMRSQCVNWFFLVLSISDLTVLIASFFVFSVPVYAESSVDIEMWRTSAILIVWFYPLAQTSLTMSVYLTILVSVHRYLGVCHPFLIRRISNSTAVKAVIITAVLFAFVFNTSRWFELQAVPCYSKSHKKESLLVIPTELMVDSMYTVIYRNAAYTLVMFFLPFAILTFVNLRIIATLRSSNKLRRQMTRHPEKKNKKKDCRVPSDTVTIARSSDASQTSTILQNSNGMSIGNGTISTTSQYVNNNNNNNNNNNVTNSSNERKENGVTVMLVAITTEFLLFNLLAFANNVLELTGAYGHSQLETILVEVSALLVNINGASTIIIYLIFGSKYRCVFKKLIHSLAAWICSLCGNRSMCSVPPHYETTQLLDSKHDEQRRWKQRLSKNAGSIDSRSGKSRFSHT